MVAFAHCVPHLRYRFYNLPIDSPGFYVYIRMEDGSVWSPHSVPAIRRWICGSGARTGIFHLYCEEKRPNRNAEAVHGAGL